VRPTRRETAHFEQTGSGAVCLQVGGVDHQLLGSAALDRQRREDLVKHAEAASADEPVVDRLVRTVAGRRIPLPQPLHITKMMPLTIL